MRSITKKPEVSRRAIIAGIGGISLSVFIPNISFGMTRKNATDFIGQVLDAVYQIINTGKPEDQMLVDFESIFRDYGNVPLIAKAVLGAPGRSASSSQITAYIAAFQIYISRKYGRQFRALAGDVFTIVGSRDAGSKGVLVQSLVDQQNKPSYDLEWWVIPVDGRPKLFDIKIEGISLISTERTEIGSILESYSGDIGKLTTHLRQF